MAVVFIGIGSNLGDREGNLRRARRELMENPGIELTDESPVEETDPVDYLEQPRFLNQVVRCETGIEPEILIDVLQNIEAKMGRRRGIPRGPRIIDLDILLYDCRIIKTERLVIPHPEIPNRDFVIRHLLTIDSELSNPENGIKYKELYNEKNKKH